MTMTMMMMSLPSGQRLGWSAFCIIWYSTFYSTNAREGQPLCISTLKFCWNRCKRFFRYLDSFIFLMVIGHHVKFLKASNFICWWGPEDRGTSPCQIFLKRVYPKQRYCDFSNFPNGRCRRFGFLKLHIIISYWGAEGQDASACQISSKLVNPLLTY